MFAMIAVFLIILWLMGFVVFPVTSGLIHLLLVVALCAFVWHLIAGRPRRV